MGVLGRWLFADRADDAETAADLRQLTAWVDRSFTDLLPLWSDHSPLGLVRRLLPRGADRGGRRSPPARVRTA